MGLWVMDVRTYEVIETFKRGLWAVRTLHLDIYVVLLLGTFGICT